MPLTLILTEGVIPEGRETEALARLSELMLKWHGLLGNEVIKPNVIGAQNCKTGITSEYIARTQPPGLVNI